MASFAPPVKNFLQKMLNPVMVVQMPRRKMIPKAAMDWFRKQGAKGGKLSAPARMEKLTAEQRSDIGKKAAAARWGKKK